MNTNTETTALSLLIDAATELRTAQLQVEAYVYAARTSGASWSQIGGILGITKQAAQQKYGKIISTTPAAAPAADFWTQADVSTPPAVTPSIFVEPATEHAHKEKDYREEKDLLRFSKATQRFIGQAEKRGLSYEIKITEPITDEPRHQLTVTVQDPQDEFHYLYWIQTHGVFNWTNPNPSHSLSYCTGTGAGGPKKVAQHRAGHIMDSFK